MRGAQFTRQQQRNSAAAKKGLSQHLATADNLTKRIASSTFIIEEYRKIYNKCCPKCQALIQRTGGKAAFALYCPACQVAATPHLKNIQVMLGKCKK